MEWSLVMKVNLQAARLWDVIESVGNYREDRSALAAILRAVSQEMQAGLAVCTTHEAWATICKVWLGTDRVKEANVERLRREFSEIPFNSGKSVEEFLLRLNTMASQLYVLGEEVTHKEVIKCLLHSITERLE
jgi:hypothetical protein